MNDVSAKIERMRNRATKLVRKKDYQNALLVITCMADVLYQYNQEYVDLDLESKLSEIQQALDDRETMETGDFPRNKKDKIVFYDGFGLDVRGLAFIYLKALTQTEYQIVYIVRDKRKDAIPTIRALLERFKAEIIYIPQLALIDEYRYLVSVMNEARPRAGFLYTAPSDVSGVMAFMHEKDQCIRYQINLTDHAFWLGRNAFDYCIEFRDYGAGVSHYYRDIPQEKIIKLPYYPYIDGTKEFEGFPFTVGEGELVLFSGGALYKTFDGKKNFYYQMVDTFLKDFEKIKFWYAGQGDDRELIRLANRYPNRVFHTAERKDLFQIMQHVDLYLNTYPLGGGLMIQYAAAAGKVPLSLKQDEATGAMIEQREVKFEFYRFEELQSEMKKLIFDREYRERQGEEIKNMVTTEGQFQNALKQIVTNQSSPYAISYRKPSVDAFQKIYYDRFREADVYKIVANPKYFGLLKFFPTWFANGVVHRGGAMLFKIFRYRS